MGRAGITCRHLAGLLPGTTMVYSTGASLHPYRTSPAVAVISHHLWRVAYQSDAAVIGSEVLLNGTAVTIVGVMDPAFTGPVSTPRSVWVPLALHGPVTGVDAVGPTTGPGVEVVARLRSDVEPEAAVASLMALTQPANSEGQSGSQPRRSPVEPRGRIQRH